MFREASPQLGEKSRRSSATVAARRQQMDGSVLRGNRSRWKEEEEEEEENTTAVAARLCLRLVVSAGLSAGVLMTAEAPERAARRDCRGSRGGLLLGRATKSSG